MSRSAKVLAVETVSVPNTNEEATEVITDYPWACDRAFYIDPAKPKPERNCSIEWTHGHARYRVGDADVIAHKIGNDFNPDGPER